MSTLSQDEKRRLNSERNNAIKESLSQEKAYVSDGKGTRNWTPEQQQDILDGKRPRDENGKAYEGHHMKSVSEYPEHAGNSSNIQWLSHEEHIQGAHRSTGHNATNGYYNPNTQETESFKGKPPIAPDANELSNPINRGQAEGYIRGQGSDSAATSSERGIMR